MNARTLHARSGPIDTLRCLAMLAVIGMHAHLLPVGWMGVWLFYVVSGYVVTLSISTRDETTGSLTRFVRFLRRRLVRIFPLYYAYLAFGLLLGAALGWRQTRFSIISLCLFFDNVAMTLGQGRVQGWPTGHLWTLSVEMQFYAIFGALMCMAPRRVTRTMFVACIVLAPVARFIIGNWLLAAGWTPLNAAFAIYVGPGLHFDIFAMGGLLAFAQRDGRLAAIAPRLAVWGVCAFLVYLGVFVAVNVLVRHAHGTEALRNVASGILIGEHREAALYSVVGVTMAGLVALAASDHRLMRPLLQLRPLQYIGVISFGGYVFHPLGLRVASLLIGTAGSPAHHGGSVVHVLQFTIGLALTLALAAVSFRWFETPLQNWFADPIPRPVQLSTDAMRVGPR